MLPGPQSCSSSFGLCFYASENVEMWNPEEYMYLKKINHVNQHGDSEQ